MIQRPGVPGESTNQVCIGGRQELANHVGKGEMYYVTVTKIQNREGCRRRGS